MEVEYDVVGMYWAADDSGTGTGQQFLPGDAGCPYSGAGASYLMSALAGATAMVALMAF